ncbi:MAG: UDP-N-acetylglucosamine 2-epimerase [Varibaculum cambriense]|nr:UDP-N-acetylglucosamine 2-epimerase [Varibaculum cambriense]
MKLQLQLAHLEAVLRFFNRRIPGEHNRVLTDHAADLLLAPTAVAARYLRNKGLAERTVLIGDVMTDVVLQAKDQF